MKNSELIFILDFKTSKTSHRPYFTHLTLTTDLFGVSSSIPVAIHRAIELEFWL